MGRIVGVLPLIDVRSMLLGRALISTAFTVGGGPLGDDEGTVHALLSYAELLGERLRANYLELRYGGALEGGWIEKTGKYAGFAALIPHDADEHLQLLPRKRRAEMRKVLAAHERGVLSVRCTQDVGAFYKLYATSMRNHGTPVLPRRFIDKLVETFGDAAEISFVDYEGAPVASLLSFYYGDAVLPYYVGAKPRARALHAFDLLYWTQMRRASARGVDTFNFGRSKLDSGPYHYKKRWGIEPAPIAYQYKLIAATSLPDVSPNNPKFERFVQLWKMLPVTVANRAGPLLASNFP